VTGNLYNELLLGGWLPDQVMRIGVALHEAGHLAIACLGVCLTIQELTSAMAEKLTTCWPFTTLRLAVRLGSSGAPGFPGSGRTCRRRAGRDSGE